MNQASQPYLEGPDRAHPCTAGDDSRSVPGPHETTVSARSPESNQRARFEAWASMPIHRRNSPGSERHAQYSNPHTQRCWEAWVAAISAHVPSEAVAVTRHAATAHEATVSKLTVVPVTLAEACEFIASFHRHNRPPRGHVFSLGVSDGRKLIGVVTVGRPIARHLDDGSTLEVTRCCVVTEAQKGTCSFLYSRAWKVAAGLGWKRLVTYTLQTESGASLRGAGWRCVAKTRGRTDAWQNRPGRDWQPVMGQTKIRWEAP